MPVEGQHSPHDLISSKFKSDLTPADSSNLIKDSAFTMDKFTITKLKDMLSAAATDADAISQLLVIN